MDVIQRLSTLWVDLISGMDPAMKRYIVRTGVGVMVMLGLAVRFVRFAGYEESTLIRQALVVTLGLIVILFLPMHWIAQLPDSAQVTLVTLCLWADLVLPFFLASNLVRTYGRQILARRVFYLMGFLGALIQLSVLGGA